MNKCLRFALFVAICPFLAGCSVQSSQEPAAKKEIKASSGVINSFAEDVTGYTALKQGRKMEEDIRRIDTEHDKDLDAILGNEE